MLFATSTQLYGELKTVTGSTFGDILPFVVVLIGIILGFFIIEIVIHSVTGKRFDDKNTGGYNK